MIKTKTLLACFAGLIILITCVIKLHLSSSTPSLAQNWKALGDNNFNIGQYEEAIPCYELIKEKYGNSTWLAEKLRVCYERINQSQSLYHYFLNNSPYIYCHGPIYIHHTRLFLVKSRDEDKFGIVDEKGATMVPLIYDGIDNFSDGLACVRLNNKFGYINPEGKQVIPVQFEFANDFLEGIALVKQFNKWGFINPKGEFVLAPTLNYDYVSADAPGLVLVREKDKWGYINFKGQVVLPLIYEAAGSMMLGFAWIWKNDKKGMIDTYGKEVLPVIYDSMLPFRDANRSRIYKGGKYGFITRWGTIAIQLKYENAHDFSEGFGWVMRNGKYTFIKPNGIEVIKPTYDNASDFCEVKLARVQLNGKYGFVDTTGKELTSIQYDDAWYFTEGLARVKKDGKCGYINTKGEEVIPLQFEDAWFFSEGLASVKQNGKWFLINHNGLITEDSNYIAASQPPPNWFKLVH